MQGTQMYIPPLSKINKTLIIIYVATFLISSFMGGSGLLGVFGLSIEKVLSGHVYQILTYPFIDLGFTAVIFNALILWFIGSELEQKWGSKFYLKYLAITSLSTALFYFVLFGFILNGADVPLYGLSGLNLALFVAYALIYSERPLLFMLIFPMKAKYFCLLLAAITIYMGIFSHGGAASWAHLFAMVVAFSYLKIKSLQARGVTISAIKEEHHKNKMRQKLRLVKEEETPPDKPDPNKPKYWQ